MESPVSGPVPKRMCPCKVCRHEQMLWETTVQRHIWKHGLAPLLDSQEEDGGQCSREKVDQEDPEDGGQCSREKIDQEDPDIICDRSDDIFGTSKEDLNVPFFDKGVRETVSKPLYPFLTSNRDVSASTSSILKLKVDHNWTNKSVEELFHVLKHEVLPENNKLPGTLFLAKKEVEQSALPLENIDACRSDCMLFWGDDENLDKCKVCLKSRYKPNTKKPMKVLRRFPLVPRLIKLFQCRSFAELVTKWRDYVSTDRLVRHVMDSEAWHHVNRIYPDFEKDDRNLRLGISIDGINPFGTYTSSWSTIPVMVVIYNLPPHLVTDENYSFLNLLIPGRKQTTNINVYLYPLIQELSILWKGVVMMDISRPVGQQEFTLKAILLFLIHDFKAYGLVACCVTQGHLACPICGPGLDSRHSSNLSTCLYTGNRRFLPVNHPFRHASQFGEPEFRMAPSKVSAGEWMQRAEDGEKWKVIPKEKKRKRDDPKLVTGIKEVSVFFELPYWSKLLIRHTLDIMHIEKNISELILYYINGLRDKDSVRDDMEYLRIRPALWMKTKSLGKATYSTSEVEETEEEITMKEEATEQMDESQQKKTLSKPHAPYVLHKSEWLQFCKVISTLRVPSLYCANLKFSFEKATKKVPGLKSHTHHRLLQDIMPLALRGLLERDARTSIIYLGRLFKKMCSKVFDPSKWGELLEDASVVISLLEREFPPAIQGIMVHLIYHAVEEITICGGVYNRWMYPFERQYKKLKALMKNSATPEASIAKSYLLKETMIFASIHAKEIQKLEGDTRFKEVMLVGQGKSKKLEELLQIQAHNYVLRNLPELEGLRTYYKNNFNVESKKQRALQQSFGRWLQDYNKIYHGEYGPLDSKILEIIEAVNQGCPSNCLHFKSMWSRGNHYRIETKDKQMITNDCTVIAKFDLGSGEVLDFVGIIIDIIELNYHDIFNVVLVHCKWYEQVLFGNEKTVKCDDDGFQLIKTKKFMSMKKENDEPFVNPEIIRQVFLTPDPLDPEWSVVTETKHVLSSISDLIDDDREIIDLKLPDDVMKCNRF